MNPSYPIKFTIQLAFKDVLKFNFYFITKAYRKFLYGLLYFIVLPFSIATIIMSLNNGETPFILIGIAIVMLVFPPVLLYNVKKSYKTNKNLHEPIEYTIDKETIHFKGLTFESSVSVKSLHKIDESKRSFHLWHSNIGANILPKHLLSQENIDALSAWMKEVAEKK